MRGRCETILSFVCEESSAPSLPRNMSTIGDKEGQSALKEEKDRLRVLLSLESSGSNIPRHPPSKNKHVL